MTPARTIDCGDDRCLWSLRTCPFCRGLRNVSLFPRLFSTTCHMRFTCDSHVIHMNSHVNRMRTMCNVHVMYWPVEQGPRQQKILFCSFIILGGDVFVKGNPVEENEDDCSFPTFNIPKVLLGQRTTLHLERVVFCTWWSWRRYRQRSCTTRCLHLDQTV